MSTYHPIVDAWVEEAVPAKNHHQSTRLRLSLASAAHETAFIALPFPPPYGATITKADLRIKLASSWSGQDITASRITGTWKENQLNFNNRPAVSATNAVTVATTGSDEDEITFDISDIYNDVSAGAAFYGIRLDTSSSTERKVYAHEHPTARLRPALDLEWVVPPDPPVGLIPGGGLSISPSAPVLAWQFGEAGYGAANAATYGAPGTDGAQASSQVQINTTTDFSSPAYDSTMTANTDSSWDMTGEGYALSDGSTYYWRVRVTNDAGSVSAWSETQSFARNVYGTLTLDNPAVSPNNYVEETTPPIAWTLTTTTQESYAVYLYGQATNGALTEIYHQPRTASSDDSFTLPKGLLKTGSTYVVKVRAWDTIDRIAIQGDPGYLEVSRDFTYNRSGTPAAVTALTATADGAKVTLAFSRSTMPDYFCVKVDGVEAADRIDPTDVFVSGTSYSLDYWGATPRVESTYEVEAVVLTSGVLKHSDGNSTDTATTTPTGIYLVDPDDSVFVRLTGPDDSADLTIGEIGTTYDLPGARAPVRIVDAIQGYGGPVTGHVGSAGERDAFLDLVGRQKPVRLLVGDLNILVELHDSGTAPTRIPGDRLFRVTTNVFQVDEFFAIAGG